MEQRSIYAQIADRTDGTVYIGVVDPVRTGKSTFIKRFMEQLVLPNIENVYERERATDELPQSGSGRTALPSAEGFLFYTLQLRSVPGFPVPVLFAVSPLPA